MCNLIGESSFPTLSHSVDHTIGNNYQLIGMAISVVKFAVLVYVPGLAESQFNYPKLCRWIFY
jgi:hypothetical protein